MSNDIGLKIGNMMANQKIPNGYFEDAWDMAPRIQLLLDGELGVLHANRMAKSLLGISDDSQGGSYLLNNFVEESNYQFIEDFISLQEGENYWGGEAVLNGCHGPIPVMQTIYKHLDENGAVKSITYSAENIEEKKSREAEFFNLQELLMVVNEAEESLGSASLVEAMQMTFEELGVCLDLKKIFILRSQTAQTGEEQVFLEYSWEQGSAFVNAVNKDQAQSFLDYGLESWRFKFQNGKPVFISGKEAGEQEARMLAQLQLGTLLILPIFTEEEYWGCLYIGHSSWDWNWTLLQINILKNLSKSMGKAFNREIYHKNLIQAKLDAELMAKSKSEFLSIMSHEIRTPMNAVVGLSHLLLMEDPREDQIENLKLLNYSSDNLLYLINDILDFNKIDAGKVEPEVFPFDLDELCRNSIASLEGKSKERNNQLEFLNSIETPLFVEGDQTRINQVINNLINNALKFTENGKVSLFVLRETERFKEDWIHFYVKDTGIGIPKDKQQIIFERFEQANISTNRMFGGTGLGLAICKKLVELFGGSIWVESEPNQGSEFHFSIPLKQLKADEFKVLKDKEEKLPSGLLNGKSILLVEDNSINILLEKKILQKWGCQVTVAENGAKAVSFFSQNTYDCVLMDLHMPVMGGLESTLKIRASETLGKRVPIVLFSADAMSEKDFEGANTGITAFATKPFKPQELYELLYRLVKE